MKPLKRIAITTGAIVVVGAAALVGRTLVMGGMFAEVKPVALECKTLTGVTGAEDIAIDRKSGLVFASATDRRATPDRPSRIDGIYVLQIAHPEIGFVKLAGIPKDFHPHGITLFNAADGSLTLMAVNHISPTQHAVDIFEVKVEDGDKLLSPNDVAAVGKERFYVTNDHGSHTPFGQTLENYLMLPRADVLYFDGSVFKEVATGLVFANGIVVSNDGNRIYVAESTARRVQTFGRDLFSGRLAQQNTFELPSGPDNIDVDGKGDLWVAAHPKMFALVAYMSDPSKPSPSEVYKIAIKSGIPQSATRVYANLGEQIGAASVGAVVHDHLFIGSIFDPKVLDCRLP
jgi:arylesterase/paraoxonase